jgi:hypothetical protein
MSGQHMRSSFSNFSGSPEQFPDPYVDVATLAMPQSMRNALQWSQYIYTTNGTYRMAMERIISYFLTDIEIEDASDEEKTKYEEFMRDVLDIMTELQNGCRDRMCYGNAFFSLLIPFKRFLTCPKCYASFPLKTVYNGRTFGFRWENFKFHANCPACKFSGAWKVEDRDADAEKELKIKRWSPHEIEMLHDDFSDDVTYFWRIPEEYKQQIRKGHLFHLENAPMKVLNAIKHNQTFQFEKDAVFHMKEPTLAGIRNRGWGLPRIMTNFRQLWYVQVLHRYNEAIALDYVIPFRLITPAPRGGAGGGGGQSGQANDPLMSFNMGSFGSQVRRMITNRRRDPAGWHMLPFPVQYQMLGGDANQLAPRELMDQGMERLLNDAGTPVELYKGTLSLQAAPVALRLFESTWHHLVHEINMFVQWVVDQTSQILNWEAVKARLQRVTIADNLEKQMAALQLMMGGQLSGTSGLAALGYNWDAEQRRIAEEARKQQEEQARMQEEMEQSGFAADMAKGNVQPGAAGAGGAPPGGGDPAAAGGAGGGGDPAAAGGMPAPGPITGYLESMSPNTPQTPIDMMATAETLANELLGLPEGQKDSELRKLKQENEVLHSLVRSKMDQIRQETRMQASPI